MSENQAYENEIEVGPPATSFSSFKPETAFGNPEKEKNGEEMTSTSFGGSHDDTIVGLGHGKGEVGYENVGPYAGMPKEVLLRYSRQKKFVWARNILTALVILTILVLIALVIAIIVISPPCLDFWQTSPIYQIYPKSYKNAESTDGFGNLKGIIEKLDYINDELGIKVVWINPIYKSPQKDNGYDISDFRDIDPIFGTMEDMDNLIIELHNRGMKLVMDFVPNHSSDQHEWFKASSDPAHDSHEKYKDYYVWVDGAETESPNNWVSEFDNTTSAWTWDSKRNQYYYHGFFAEQPDLNLRNPDVREELKDILRFWLEKGVDGFRCDAVAFSLEAEHLRNNPVKDETAPVNKDNVYPDYTQNYMGVHDLVAEWRGVLDEYSTEPGVYRFMETEVYTDISTTMRYYGTDRNKEADFPMNFLLLDADPETDWTAENMKQKIMEWMTNMPEGRWPNWVMGNHDNPRLPSRVGDRLARCAAVLIMTLPGTPGLYYGDEIGMTDNDDIPDIQDFRDPYRTPMQWNVDENAGFCTNCTPWLPVNDNYKSGLNVLNETEDQDSVLSMYKELISLRTDTVYQRGYLCLLDTVDDTLLFIRELPGLDSKLIAINFENDTTNPTSFNLVDLYPNMFPSSGKVEFFSTTDPGERVNFDNVEIRPGSSFIVSYRGGRKFNEQSGKCFIHLKVCYNSALGIVQTC